MAYPYRWPGGRERCADEAFAQFVETVTVQIGADNVARLYVAGKPVTEQALGGRISAVGWGWYHAVSLGTYGKAFGAVYTGDLAEVRWWSRAATDAEISAAAAVAP